MRAWMPRAAAALVAIICWAALGIRLEETFADNGNLLGSAWILLRFFTIITNLVVAVAMTMVAFGKQLSDGVLGGLALAMMLVGIVYATLLAHLYQMTGLELLADNLMHRVAPVAMTLYWLVVPPHGGLRWVEPLRWSIYPIVYLVYALVRGAADHIYPYPFIDVGQIGMGQTLINAAGISIAFLISGVVLVWLDRRVLGHSGLLAKARR